MRPLKIKPFATLALATAITALIAIPGRADSAGHVVDNGIDVYYAVIPAEIIRGHETQHSEATMHGGPPSSKDARHLMVALFEAATKRRITDAQVTAKVQEVGLAGEEKKLEPFSVAGAVTYGNYFFLSPNTNYRVQVDVTTLSSEKQAHIEFSLKEER